MDFYKTSFPFNKNRNNKLEDLSIFKNFIEKRSNMPSYEKKLVHKKSEKFFLTQNNSQNKLETLKEDKTKNIKQLLKPKLKNFIYDGYAVKRKKYSYRELIEKVSKNENGECIEKNKLFKNTYPLIKFLSNKKLFNNSSSLLIDLLNNDTSKLSKKQLTIINNHCKTINNNNNKNNNKNNNNNNKINNSFNNNLNNSEKCFNKTQLFYTEKINKNYKTINAKRNIRLKNFFISKKKIFIENNYNNNNYNNNIYNNNFFDHYNKDNLPLLNKYIKDKIISKNYNNKSKSFLKYNNSNKVEKYTSINTELFNNSNKDKLNDNNNNSKNDEESETYKIRSITNFNFRKKNRKLKWIKKIS